MLGPSLQQNPVLQWVLFSSAKVFSGRSKKRSLHGNRVETTDESTIYNILFLLRVDVILTGQGIYVAS